MSKTTAKTFSPRKSSFLETVVTTQALTKTKYFRQGAPVFILCNIVSLLIKIGQVAGKEPLDSAEGWTAEVFCSIYFILLCILAGKKCKFLQKYWDVINLFSGIAVTAVIYETAIAHELLESEDLKYSLHIAMLPLLTYSLFFSIMIEISAIKGLLAAVCCLYLIIRGVPMNYSMVPYSLMLYISLFYYLHSESVNNRELRNEINQRIQDERIWKTVLNALPNSVALMTQEKNLFYVNSSFKSVFRQRGREGLRSMFLGLQNLSIRSSTASILQDLFQRTFLQTPGHAGSTTDGRLKSDEQTMIAHINDGFASESIDMLALLEFLYYAIEKKVLQVKENSDPIVVDMVSTEDVASSVFHKKVKRTYEIMLTPLELHKKAAFLILINETTQSQMVNYLEESINFKSNLFSTFSHELRTPLNAVMNLILSGMVDNSISENIKNRYLQPAYSSSKTLLQLVNDLMDLSMIMMKKFKLNSHEFSVRELIQEIEEDFTQKLECKQLQFIVQCAEDVQDCIVSDKQRIAQVLYNLIGNSVKFTYKGYVKLLVCQSTSTLLEISIEDTGIGIEEADLISIKESLLEGADSKLTHNTAGIGLGLRVSYMLAICLAHPSQKSLSIESTSNTGTRVSFYVNTDPATSRVDDWRGISNLMKGNNSSVDLTVKSSKSMLRDFSLGKSTILRHKEPITQSNTEKRLGEVQEENKSEGVTESENFDILVSEQVSISKENLAKYSTHFKQSGVREPICSQATVESQEIPTVECKCNDILIVDDDHYNILALQTVLDMLGEKEHAAAANGQLAIEVSKEETCSEALRRGMCGIQTNSDGY